MENYRIAKGIIAEIDREHRSFATMQNQDFMSMILFHAADEIVIVDVLGNRMDLEHLALGMQVEVVHADYMTASLPPQTTAFEVRVL